MSHLTDVKLLSREGVQRVRRLAQENLARLQAQKASPPRPALSEADLRAKRRAPAVERTYSDEPLIVSLLDLVGAPTETPPQSRDGATTT